MRNKSFPKENQKKLNEVIRNLRAEIRQQEKEIKFLRNEIENIVKPVRERKKQIEQSEEDRIKAWKVDFIHRFKRDVLGNKD